jgi:hypothetical protein
MNSPNQDAIATHLNGYNFPRVLRYNPINFSTLLIRTNYVKRLQFGQPQEGDFKINLILLFCVISPIKYYPRILTKDLTKNHYLSEININKNNNSNYLIAVGSKNFHNAIKNSYFLNLKKFPLSYEEYKKIYTYKISKKYQVESVFRLQKKYRIFKNFADYRVEFIVFIKPYFPEPVWIILRKIANIKFIFKLN